MYVFVCCFVFHQAVLHSILALADAAGTCALSSTDTDTDLIASLETLAESTKGEIEALAAGQRIQSSVPTSVSAKKVAHAQAQVGAAVIACASSAALTAAAVLLAQNYASTRALSLS